MISRHQFFGPSAFSPRHLERTAQQSNSKKAEWFQPSVHSQPLWKPPSQKMKKRLAKTLGWVHQKNMNWLNPWSLMNPIIDIYRVYMGLLQVLPSFKSGDMLFFTHKQSPKIGCCGVQDFCGFPRLSVRWWNHDVLFEKWWDMVYPFGCSRGGLFMAQLRFFHKKSCFSLGHVQLLLINGTIHREYSAILHIYGN